MKNLILFFLFATMQLFAQAQCSNPPQVNIRSDYDTINCYHYQTTLHADIIGGTAPFVYEWKVYNSVIGTDSTFLAQNFGATSIYTLKITDVNGCFAHDSIRIVSNIQMLDNLNFVNDVSASCACCVKIFDRLGTPNYTYWWSNINTIQDTTIICGAGTHNIEVVVTDISSGCSIIYGFPISINSSTEMSWQQGAECRLLRDNQFSWYNNVNYPFGLGWVGAGVPLSISFRDSSLVSFCQQGREVFIECADVLYGTTSTTLPNQSVLIGHNDSGTNSVYRWYPNVGLPYMSNDTLAQIYVTPTENSIFIRYEYYDPNCTTMTCPADITYYNVHVLRNTSDCLVLTNTNAAEKTSEKISVFPNPTTGDITIRQTIPHCNLQIYNTLGQVVLNETLQDGENKISLPAYLPNGIYYLKTFNENRVLYANKLVLLRE